jgi:hypothetical protein
MIQRIRHRLWQGFRALTAFARPVDYAAVAEVLSPELLMLFKRMRRSEQIHCLHVMNYLRAHGHEHPDLLTAALLHDVGKSRYPLTLVGRTMAVLVRRFLPKHYNRWAQSEPRGWRRPFVIAVQHPIWSAEDMAAAGAAPLAVALARRHQTLLDGAPRDEEDRLLLLLREADRAS